MEGLGETIRFLRQEKRIPQGKLCGGLCSDTTLSRIEWGEREPDKPLTDALLQRLGESPDKFWTIVHIRDYELMELRRKIWEEILCSNYTEAEKGIRQYEKQAGDDHLHRQYLCKCRGLLEGKRDGNWQESQRLFQEAIHLTIPEFSEDKIGEYLLGREEIYLVLLSVQAYDMCGEAEKARMCTEALLENINGREWDEEEFVKIYPKVVSLYVKFLREDDRYEDVITLSRKAMGLLVENGVIFLLEEFMSQILWGMERRISREGRGFVIAEEQEYERLTVHRAVLQEIWKEYAEIPEQNIWYCTNLQQDVSVSNEIIKKCRKLSRLSQEQLSENICTVENLSRIERGRVIPTERSYQSLMEKMNQVSERNRYFVNVEEYEIHEKIRKIAKYINRGEVYQATELWKSVRGRLDGSTLENRQCKMRYDTIIKYVNHKIDWKESVVWYRKALEITMPEFETMDITMWPMSRSEIFLLTNIAEGHRNMGQLQAADNIYRNLRKIQEESEVDVRYRATEYFLVLYHSSLVSEGLGNHMEAYEMAEKGIWLCIRTGRINMAPYFLYSMAWILNQWSASGLPEEQKAENHKKACHFLRQAFYVSNTLCQFRLSDEIGSYYMECFQEELNY